MPVSPTEQRLGSADFALFEVSGFSSELRQAAEFLGGKTLRYTTCRGTGKDSKREREQGARSTKKE